MFRLESRNLLLDRERKDIDSSERGVRTSFESPHGSHHGKHHRRQRQQHSNHDRKLCRRFKEFKQLVVNSRGDPKSRIVLLSWSEPKKALIVIFSNGLIAWLFYESKALKTLHYLHLDKYLVGRCKFNQIAEASISEGHIFLSHPEASLTAVFMEKSSSTTKGYKLKRKKHLKIQEIDLVTNQTSSKRRIDRHLIDKVEESLLMVWWQNGANFLSPWTAPNTLEISISNVFVYDYLNNNFSLLYYGSIMNDIMKIAFAYGNSKSLLSVERTNVANTVKLCLYTADLISDCEVLQLINVMNITLSSPCLKVDFNLVTDRLFILCEDRGITIFNIHTEAIVCFGATINAVDLICCPLDSFFVIADEYGQILLYDYCLNVISANYDDLCLNDTAFGLKSSQFINDRVIALTYTETKDFIFIILPVHVDCLTLISEYVKHDYVKEALLNLKNFNWNTSALLLYSAINLVFTHLLKFPLSPNRETQIESALGVYFNPNHEVEPDILEDFKLEMHYLAKKFFFHLLRYSCFEKAFLLALDLKSVHLFNLLHKVAVQKGNHSLAEACKGRIGQLKEVRQIRKRRKRYPRNKSQEGFAKENSDERLSAVASVGQRSNSQAFTEVNLYSNECLPSTSQSTVKNLYNLPSSSALRHPARITLPPQNPYTFDDEDITIYYNRNYLKPVVSDGLHSRSAQPSLPPSLPPRMHTVAKGPTVEPLLSPPPLPPRRQSLKAPPVPVARHKYEIVVPHDSVHVPNAKQEEAVTSFMTGPSWSIRAKPVESSLSALPNKLVPQILSTQNSAVDFQNSKIECVHFGVV